MHVTARASDSGDTAAGAVVKNYVGNDCLEKRRAWFVLVFFELFMERARSSSLVIRDIVL